MTLWKDRVYELDNLLYGGAYYVPGKWVGRLELQGEFFDYGLKCSREMANAREAWKPATTKSNITLKDALRDVPCFENILKKLEGYHANGTSLLFSNELKSTNTAYKKMPGYPRKVSQDWLSLAAALGDDWNFMLILGYRPYLDWVRFTDRLSYQQGPSFR